MRTASAWDGFVKSDSPDGLYEAVFDDAGEICMGGPVAGTLVIREKETGRIVARMDDANGAFVWAADSGALAYPKWTADRCQKLAVVWIPGASQALADSTFAVLELESFEDGVVEGIDSPISHPRRIRVRFERRRPRGWIFWRGRSSRADG